MVLKISKKVFLVLVVLILIRLVTAPYPFDDTIPDSPDHQTYLHMVQMIKDHGFVKWDEYWYGGMPFLRFYPPLSFVLAAMLPFSDIISYKLILVLFWSIAPIAAYLMFKEFDLTLNQTLVATSAFSLTAFFAVRFIFVQAPTFVAIPLALMFMRHFIRFNKNYNKLDFSLAAIFLALTALTHLIPATMIALISLIYLISNHIIKYKNAIYCYCIAFLISSFWTIPFLLEQKYVNVEELTSLSLISPIKFIHAIFGYYSNYLSILATLIIIILIALYIIKEKQDKFVVWTFAALLISYLIGYGHVGERTLIFASLPIALMMAALYKNHKPLIIGFIALQSILFFSYLYPVSAGVPTDELQVAQFLFDKEGRVNVIPPYSALASYTFPKHNISLSYGGYGRGVSNERVAFSEGTLMLNLECKRSLEIPELLSNLDLLSKKSASVDSKCIFNTDNISENFGRSFIKHVVISNNYPDVINFFSTNLNFEEELKNNKYTVYKFLNESEFASPKADYERTDDTIIIYNITSGTISESWYPHWSAEGYTLGKDKYGFITFSGSGALELVYKEPEFYGWLYYISGAVFVFIIYLALPISSQRRSIQNRTS
jgi:hypothetical protein